jgi:hypothetical protein
MAAAEDLANGWTSIVEKLQEVDTGGHPIYDEFDVQQGTLVSRHGLRVGNKGFNAEWWFLGENYAQPPSGGDGSTRVVRIDHSTIDETVDPNDTTAFPFPANGALVIVVWQ